MTSLRSTSTWRCNRRPNVLVSAAMKKIAYLKGRAGELRQEAAAARDPKLKQQKLEAARAFERAAARAIEGRRSKARRAPPRSSDMRSTLPSFVLVMAWRSNGLASSQCAQGTWDADSAVGRTLGRPPCCRLHERSRCLQSTSDTATATSGRTQCTRDRSSSEPNGGAGSC